MLVAIVHTRFKKKIYLKASDSKIFAHWPILYSDPNVFRYVDTLYQNIFSVIDSKKNKKLESHLWWRNFLQCDEKICFLQQKYQVYMAAYMMICSIIWSMNVWIMDPLNPLNTIVLWCTGGFRGTLNWAPMMPRDASLSDSYKSVGDVFPVCFSCWFWILFAV